MVAILSPPQYVKWTWKKPVNLFFQQLFTLNMIFLSETVTIQCIFNQHCGYWWPGALAPGHQWPQCWLYIHVFSVVYGLKYKSGFDLMCFAVIMLSVLNVLIMTLIYQFSSGLLGWHWGIFTQGQFWLSGICCACICVSVCPSVPQLMTSLSAPLIEVLKCQI